LSRGARARKAGGPRSTRDRFVRMSPEPTYVARAGSPLAADPAIYGPIGRETGARTILRSEVIPVRTGRAWTADAGSVVRFSIIVRAVLPFGLTEFAVHDVINVFQVTGLMADDERYFMKTSPARLGDHFELFCEIDLLMAVSTCPGGDLSVPIWGPESGAEPV